MNDEEFVKVSVVYTGIRLDDKDERFCSFRMLTDEATLGRELFFKYSKGFDKVLCQVYSCQWRESTGSIKGVDRASWLFNWPVESDRIDWHAEDAKAKTRLNRKKLEKSGKVSDVERILKPLREMYDAKRARYDREGCRALEELVMQALRTPIRGSEE